jgi:hypothetical protein
VNTYKIRLHHLAVEYFEASLILYVTFTLLELLMPGIISSLGDISPFFFVCLLCGLLVVLTSDVKKTDI